MSGNERTDEDLVQVYATASIPDGALMKGLLEAEGISVWEKGPAGGDPYMTGGTYLFVFASDEARARAILNDVASGERAGAGDAVAAPETN